MQYTDLTSDALSQNSAYDNHEIVRRFVLDEEQGIVALVAVHNTALGPSLGGCRIKTYESEDAALYDVLRLSRGMTYKNAMAGLPLGGGKAVIICDANTQKTDALMEKFGQAVDSLDGKYITAEDSGSTEEDMACVLKHTMHVAGLNPELLKERGYDSLGGNPSPLTALGCFEGIKAAVLQRYDRNDLNGLRAAVQGVGAVGLALCELMKSAGMDLVIADINDLNLQQAQKVLGQVEIVRPDQIYAAAVDVFVPCALGGVLNDDTIPQIQADIIAGPANNQLAEERHDEMLAAQNITYVPDYVINAGGVICVGYEYAMTADNNPYDFTLTEFAMTKHVCGIGKTVNDILVYARENHVNPGVACDKMAEDKFMSGVASANSQSRPSAA